MHSFKEKYIVDENGNKIRVFLSIDNNNIFLAEIEDVEEIRSYDEAKSLNDEMIPFETAMQEIEEDKSDYYSALQVKISNKNNWTSHTDLKKELGI